MPLAERGVMPNLARALERGRHGRLQSCLPPYSSPAWMSISTGKNPGSHGIFDFWEAGAPGEKRLVSSRSARGRKLWELVDDAGKVAHVVAVPVSYPAAQLEHGTFVCGMFTPGEAVDYTWPQELKAELKALPGGYRADPYADGLEGAAVHRADALRDPPAGGRHRHLLDKGDWDLLFSVIQAPDPIQHKFWNVLDPTDPRYDAEQAREHLPLLEESYRRCDEVIGDRLAMAERGAFVMVVSDHGFGRYEKNFYLNRVLEEHGLLFRQRSAKQVAPRRSRRGRVIDTHPPARRARAGGARAAPVPRAAGARHRLGAVGADRQRADAGLRGRALGRERLHLAARAGRPSGAVVARARDRGARGGPRSRDRRADHRARATAARTSTTAASCTASRTS